MKIEICENYEEMSRRAAEIFQKEIKENPKCVLGLATGSTPVGMYEKLCTMGLDFSGVKTVNLDEYYPISPENENSYRYFMNENLFSKVNIDKKNTHVPNGAAKNPDKECRKYDEMIENLGGIDLQVLGIGANGHIGFNEPGAELVAKTHVTALTESTIKANARFFDDISSVPTHALTMGIITLRSTSFSFFPRKKPIKGFNFLCAPKLYKNFLISLWNSTTSPMAPTLTALSRMLPKRRISST